MIELVTPTTELHKAWLECAFEFGEAVHRPGFADGPYADDELETTTGFARFVREQIQGSDPAHPVRPEWVHASLFWIVDSAQPHRILGSLHLRHELNAFLLEEGGHIGYAVRPSARRSGVASAALHLGLGEAAALGIDRALLTCDDDNVASAKTIEGAGGVLEDVRNGKRRYWINTSHFA